MRRTWAVMLVALACGLPPALGAGPAEAPSSAATAPSVQAGDVEQGAEGRVLRRRAAVREPTSGAVAPDGAQSLGWQRVLLALAVVVALILVMRWIVRRFVVGSSRARGKRFAEVLARVPIAPRQHLVLMRVGRRLLVVGDSGGQQLATLCEITDADEIAGLLAEARSDGADALTKAFSTVFGQAGAKFEQASEAPSGAAEGAGADAPAETPDAALAGTRKELSGLAEKVRLLARQVGRNQ
jgi:flagellar biogenesis protein FliO